MVPCFCVSEKGGLAEMDHQDQLAHLVQLDQRGDQERLVSLGGTVNLVQQVEITFSSVLLRPPISIGVFYRRENK